MSEDFRNALSGDLLNEAASWHARLARAEPEERLWGAFTDWLEADSRHRLAFDQVERLYGDLDELAETERDRIVQVALCPVIAFPTHRSRRPLWIGAAFLALAAASLLAIVSLRPVPSEIQRIITAPGETRHLVAADGSLLDLNGGTTINVALSSGQRQVQVEEGELLLKIAADPRPFVVVAGNYEIRDIGTVFDVVSTKDLTRVSVEQGKVSVAAAGARANPMLVSAGERFERREGGDPTMRSIDPVSAGSWKNGYLVYDDAPISQVVADVSRYGQRKIALQGSDSSFRHFSGILKIDSEDAMLDRLAQLLPLAIDRAGEGPVMLRAAPPAK